MMTKKNDTKVRKLIDLEKWVKMELTIQAAKKEMSLKEFIEYILEKQANKNT